MDDIERIEKFPRKVLVHFLGSTLEGEVFMTTESERLLDFMNDSKPFFPLRVSGPKGRVRIIAKSKIDDIQEIG